VLLRLTARTSRQWLRNEFESGGGGTDLARSAGKNFYCCAHPFFAQKAQLVVLVSAFVMVSTVWSVSCLLFFYSWCLPRAQPFVKVGARAPRAHGVGVTASRLMEIVAKWQSLTEDDSRRPVSVVGVVQRFQSLDRLPSYPQLTTAYSTCARVYIFIFMYMGWLRWRHSVYNTHHRQSEGILDAPVVTLAMLLRYVNCRFIINVIIFIIITLH